MSKKNILSYSYENLEKELLELDFKKFNAKQIFEWLHKKITRKFDEMTNISLKQREILKELLCQSFTEQSSPVAHVHLNHLIFRSSLLHVPMNLNRSLLCNLGKLISSRPFLKLLKL